MFQNIAMVYKCIANVSRVMNFKKKKRKINVLINCCRTRLTSFAYVTEIRLENNVFFIKCLYKKIENCNNFDGD